MMIKNILIALIYAIVFLLSGTVNWPFQLCVVCVSTFSVSFYFVQKQRVKMAIITMAPAYLVYSFDTLYNHLIHVYPIVLMPPIIVLIVVFLNHQKKFKPQIVYIILLFLFTVPCYYGMIKWLSFEASLTPTSNLGEKMPSIHFLTAKNESFSLNIENDSVFVFDFWSTSCGTCFREFPEYKSLNEKLRNKRVRFFTVNIPIKKDSFNKTVNLIQKYFDDNLFIRDSLDLRKLNITAVPYYVVTKRDKILFKGHLPIFGNTIEHDLEDEIIKALNND